MTTTISIVVGSTRDNRFSETAARWIQRLVDQRPGLTTRLLDLRDYNLPFFDSATPPGFAGRPAYGNAAVRHWTEQIAGSDAFVVATPEYNYGPPAVLKNALDWVHPEWQRKPIAFVSWGSVGGARAVQQLRETAIELQMAPIRNAVPISAAAMYAHFQGKSDEIEAVLKSQDDIAARMIDDLLWWSDALKSARAATV